MATDAFIQDADRIWDEDNILDCVESAIFRLNDSLNGMMNRPNRFHFQAANSIFRKITAINETLLKRIITHINSKVTDSLDNLYSLQSTAVTEALSDDSFEIRHRRRWLLLILGVFDTFNTIETIRQTNHIEDFRAVMGTKRQLTRWEMVYHHINESLWEAYGGPFKRYIHEARNDALMHGLTPIPLNLWSGHLLWDNAGNKTPISLFPSSRSLKSSMLDNEWRQIVLENYQELRRLDPSMPAQKVWRM